MPGTICLWFTYNLDFFPLSLRFTLVSLNMLKNRFSFEENWYIYLEFYFTGTAKFLCISFYFGLYVTCGVTGSSA